MKIKLSILFYVLLLFLLFASSDAMAANLLYAAHGSGAFTVADPASYGVITSYSVGEGANWVVVNPAGTFAYVNDYAGDKIDIVKPSTNQIIGTISLAGPSGMAINAAGNKMYVAMYDDNKVAVIDLTTNTVTKYITVGSGPFAVRMTVDGSKVYVANNAGDTFSIISTNTDTVSATVEGAQNGPSEFAFNGDGSKVFVLEDQGGASNGKIMVYSTSTNALLGTISLDNVVPSLCHALTIDTYYVWAGISMGSDIVEGYYTDDYSFYTNLTLPDNNDAVRDLVFSNDKMYIAHGSNITIYDIITYGSYHIDANISTNNGDINGLSIFTPSESTATVTPQLVTFTAKTCYRTMAITGLNVSVYDNTTNTLLYSGVTDSTGSINFILVPTTKYDVLFNQSPNINTWYYITPSYTGYVVDIPFGHVVGITSWSSTIYNPPGEEISWTLGVTYNSTTGAGSLTPTYNDTGTVSSVTFSFYQNASFGEADQLLENQTPAGSGSWTYTENLVSATGNSYYVIITVVKPDGTFTYVSGLAYTFPGPKVLAGVFPADWYFWIAWGAVLCFYAVGTITKKGLFAVFGAAMSIIMAKWGWYSLVFPDTIAYLAIGFTFIMAIVVTIIERERYT